MTNYEWLVENGKLAEFTFDIAYRGIRDITNLEMIAYKYNLPVDLAKTEGGQNSRAIAYWLQEERKPNEKDVAIQKIEALVEEAQQKYLAVIGKSEPDTSEAEYREAEYRQGVVRGLLDALYSVGGTKE